MVAKGITITATGCNRHGCEAQQARPINLQGGGPHLHSSQVYAESHHSNHIQRLTHHQLINIHSSLGT